MEKSRSRSLGHLLQDGGLQLEPGSVGGLLRWGVECLRRMPTTTEKKGGGTLPMDFGEDWNE